MKIKTNVKAGGVGIPGRKAGIIAI